MELANKYKRQLNAKELVYALLMAVSLDCKGSDDAEKYIIDNKP